MPPKTSQFEMDQLEHQLGQLAMGSAGEREQRPKKSRDWQYENRHEPIFQNKHEYKDFQVWEANMREQYRNGDWRGPQRYNGPQYDGNGNYVERHTGYTPTTPTNSREASTDTWCSGSGQWVSQSSCGSDDGFNIVREACLGTFPKRAHSTPVDRSGGRAGSTSSSGSSHAGWDSYETIA